MAQKEDTMKKTGIIIIAVIDIRINIIKVFFILPPNDIIHYSKEKSQSWLYFITFNDFKNDVVSSLSI